MEPKAYLGRGCLVQKPGQLAKTGRCGVHETQTLPFHAEKPCYFWPRWLRAISTTIHTESTRAVR